MGEKIRASQRSGWYNIGPNTCLVERGTVIEVYRGNPRKYRRGRILKRLRSGRLVEVDAVREITLRVGIKNGNYIITFDSEEK